MPPQVRVTITTLDGTVLSTLVILQDIRHQHITTCEQMAWSLNDYITMRFEAKEDD